MDEEPKLPPLRNLDDFFVGARFGLPDYQNADKWNNRVIQNLMYYQTNYFIILALVIIFMCFVQPIAMLYGLVLYSCLLGLLYMGNSRYQMVTEIRRKHPTSYLLFLIVVGAACIYIVSKTACFLLSFLFPLLVVLTHSSLRMRNFNNKIQNKVEAVGLKKTIMGMLMKEIIKDF